MKMNHGLKLSLTLAFFQALFWSTAYGGDEIEKITKFYLVRHAEKASSTGDPPLRADGVRRSIQLRTVLADVPLAAVYSTQTLRTQQTASPILEASGLQVSHYPVDGLSVEAWAQSLVNEHRGDQVLIVGHSGTINHNYSIASIAHALSGDSVPDISESQYGNLFEVTIHHHKSGTVKRMFKRAWYGNLEMVNRLAVDDSMHKISNRKDISAISLVGGILVVGADEDDEIQTLRFVSEGSTQKLLVQQPFSLGNEGELDIEALAYDGAFCYVLGSHSRKRKKLDPSDEDSLNKTYSKNLEYLKADKIKKESKRAHIYRVKVDPTSGESPTFVKDKDIRLRDVFSQHDVLKLFESLASKENGIDIEGLSTDGESLFLGFRAPVLRHGFVPVMKIKFDDQSTAELRYVQLGGRGIRDITNVQEGFLIVAGPVGDSTLSFQLYHWDGKDCVPGIRENSQVDQGQVTLLGTIPTPAGGKAEGIAVLKSSEDHYKVLVAYDGVKNGGFTIFRAPRPR